MNAGLVSVVIPVYGVEKYLDRCLESVVNQTYSDLEILLIDDGSPDGCPEICDAWAQRDSRIRVIHQENGGIGVARNTGMEEARGDYLCFFDPDDYILADTIEKAWNLMEAAQTELVVFGFQTVDTRGSCLEEFVPQTTKQVYRDGEILEYFLPNLIGYDMQTGNYTKLNMSACMTFFSMDLIRRTHWRFVSEREIISEDIYSLLELYGDVRSVAVLPEPLYCYCENMASASRAYREDRYSMVKIFYNACLILCKQKGYPQTVADQLRIPFLSSVSAVLKQLTRSALPLGRQMTMARELMEDSLLQQVLSSLDLEKETRLRRIFFTAILKKQFKAAFCLILLKERMDRHKGFRRTLAARR